MVTVQWDHVGPPDLPGLGPLLKGMVPLLRGNNPNYSTSMREHLHDIYMHTSLISGQALIPATWYQPCWLSMFTHLIGGFQ